MVRLVKKCDTSKVHQILHSWDYKELDTNFFLSYIRVHVGPFAKLNDRTLFTSPNLYSPCLKLKFSQDVGMHVRVSQKFTKLHIHALSSYCLYYQLIYDVISIFTIIV